MKARFSSLLVLFLIASPAFAKAKKRKVASPELVEQVLKEDGIMYILGRSINAFTSTLNQRKADYSFSAEQQTKVLSYARRIYQSKNLFEIFKIVYGKNITETALKEKIEFLNTPTGEKLKQINKKLYAVGAQQLIAQYLSKSAKGKLKDFRKLILKSYLSAFKLPYALAEQQVGADFGVSMGLRAFQAKGSQDTTKYLIAKSNSKKHAILRAMETETFNAHLYFMRTFKNDDIEKLTKFHSSSSGQAHARAFIKAMRLTLERAALTLYTSISKSI